MARFVVDANVVVKWATNEEYWQNADAVRSADELLAPSLIVVEALSALTQKFRRRELPESIVRRAHDDLLHALTLFPSQPRIPAALELSLELGINMYDAIYVALAFEQDCQLVSADAGLTNSTSRRLRELVLPLRNVPIL